MVGRPKGRSNKAPRKKGETPVRREEKSDATRERSEEQVEAAAAAAVGEMDKKVSLISTGKRKRSNLDDYEGPPAATHSTQMYWYHAPEKLQPWSDNEALQELLVVSEIIGNDTTIVPRRALKMATNKVVNSVWVRDKDAECAGVEGEGGLVLAHSNGGIHVDCRMSPLGVLNEVFLFLKKEPYQLRQVKDHIQALLQSNPRNTTLPHVLEDLVEERGLRLTPIESKEMKQRCFTATDVREGEALVIVDREDPMFVVAYRSNTKTGIPVLHLLCGHNDPKPWRRTVKALRKVSRYTCEMFLIQQPQDDEEEDDGQRKKKRKKKVHFKEVPTGNVNQVFSTVVQSYEKLGPNAGEGIGGNPFSLLPKQMNKKQRRQQKSTVHSWRVRLIEFCRRKELYDKAAVAEDGDAGDEYEASSHHSGQEGSDEE